MIGRRGIFKALMALPLAARTAADETIAAVSGLGPDGCAGFGSNGFVPPSANARPAAQWVSPTELFKIAKAALNLPIPDWRIDEIREEAKSVYRLDPDIAALRSFSMSAKITWQRERNLQMRIEGMRKGNLVRAKREEFEQRHGFWFY